VGGVRRRTAAGGVAAQGRTEPRAREPTMARLSDFARDNALDAVAVAAAAVYFLSFLGLVLGALDKLSY
jgi:hypothetical protein